MDDAPRELWVQLAAGGRGTISYREDPHRAGFDNGRATYHYHLTQPSNCYSLADIKELAKQWANERQISEHSRWQVSELLAWLAKREQGKGVRDDDLR